MLYMLLDEHASVTYCKIGRTNRKNFNSRMQAYKTHNPNTILVSITNTDRANDKAVEIWCHHELKEQWYLNSVNRTEWVEIPNSKQKLLAGLRTKGLDFLNVRSQTKAGVTTY